MAYIFTTDQSLPVHVPKFETVGEGRLNEPFYEALRSGDSIDPAPLPKVERLKSRHKAIPEVFQGPAITYVSEPVKDLIESLEPDVHQFIEIKLLDKQGDPYDKRYFRFHIRQWLDAMVIEKSTLTWKQIPHSDRYRWMPSEPPSREHFTASKDLISGKHFWMDRKMYHTNYFCSDEFHDAFNANGFKRLRFQHVDEDEQREIWKKAV